MMTGTRQLLTAVCVIALISPLAAREVANVALSINNDTTSTITIIQPAGIEAMTLRGSVSTPVDEKEVARYQHDAEDQAASTGKTAGYRVQVFSDNNQRTAKGEARQKERQLREAFPDYGTYVVYNSPFWRLKVGDFKTQHEAEAAADQIRSRFPAFSREVRVVKDRVNSR
ncbi:MAG: SPOR domain-containing protein [Clostridiales bacterium]|nr:SPOR domain-containing protein [Clostridiales bacterium]